MRVNGHVISFLIVAMLCCPLHLANVAQPTSLESSPVIQMQNQSTVSDLTPHSSILITRDSDFTNQGWPGTGTIEHPYTIAHLLLSPSSGSFCINITGEVTANYTIANCSVEGNGAANGFFLSAGHSLVETCNFTGVDIAVEFDSIDNSAIGGCTVSTTGTDFAILIENCQNTTISSCTVRNAGVRVSNSPFTEIAFCYVWESNTTGFYLEHSQNCTLGGISVFGGLGDGLLIAHTIFPYVYSSIITEMSGAGISVLNSSACNFVSVQSIHNGIGFLLNSTQFSTLLTVYSYQNTDSGMILINSNSSIIVGCSFYSNGAHGLRIVSGTENLIFNNYLGFNVLSAGIDDGLWNIWDYAGTSEGNYWDYWDGVGYKLIPGTGGQSDHYPQHWVFPEITQSSSNRIIEQGDYDEWVYWYFQGTNPLMCMVLRNESLLEFDLLDESVVHEFVPIGARPVGVYNFTIIITYECGIVLIDSILVTVLPQEGPFFRGYEIIGGPPAANSEVVIRLEVADWTSIRYVGLSYRVNGILTYDVNVSAVYDHLSYEGDLHIEWCDVTLPETFSEGDIIEFQGFSKLIRLLSIDI